MTDFQSIVGFIKDLYKKDIVPLHEPRFIGNEKKYLAECIESTFVSYVGKFVTQFEESIKRFTGSKYAVAIVNGTSALHIALAVSGVKEGDEVLAPALTFVGSINPICYLGARPFFIDCEKETLGMCPEKLEEFLEKETVSNDGTRINKITGKKIAACIVVHVFGHPAKIDKIKEICDKYKIELVEDAAESLGSRYKDKHTGTFAKIGILSFNGNKVVTTGGGGMIITDDEEVAREARHVTTTAKLPHKWEFIHDRVGYNYRMPNVNAAIGVAQMENINQFLKNKRELAAIYGDLFRKDGTTFFVEKENSRSNYWLNALILKDRQEKDAFLEFTNSNGVMTRPSWRSMNKLPMFTDCGRTNLDNSEWIEARVVNIPSSVRI